MKNLPLLFLGLLLLVPLHLAADVDPGFVGDETCAGCHAEQTAAWRGSHHDLAMQPANAKTVRGNFNNQVFEHRQQKTRFFRDGDRYLVETAGPDGSVQTFVISYTFGWEPLQQYLVEMGNGKRQVLDIAWDVPQARWFKLNPEADVAPGDWMHWTGGAMNWNTMCADCHSTYLRHNYSAASDSFDTRWSSINVSCEACHGPGRSHIEAQASPETAAETSLLLTSSASQQAQINQCAACHSLRERLTAAYPHSGDFTNHFSPSLPLPPAYADDGQILEEVYVYGSFLQSRMYREGVVCSDCHDPHSLQLKAPVSDNSLCLQCHETTFNTAAHHFHEPGTASGQCVNCHMPGRNYMEIDFRRDHSFRIPRPDLSMQFDTPNACNGCHTDRDATWATSHIATWYGNKRQARQGEVLALAAHAGPTAVAGLTNLATDQSQSGLTRAAAMFYLAPFAGATATSELFTRLASDPNETVRRTAASALAGSQSRATQRTLVELLADENRSVRLAAVEPLAGITATQLPQENQQPFIEALKEYQVYLTVNEYFPAGSMNLAMYQQRQGNLAAAEQAYRRVLAKDHLFNPARINLAYLLNAAGRNPEARQLLLDAIRISPDEGQLQYSMALLLTEMGQLPDALPYFVQAAALTPTNARMVYNLAVAQQQLGDAGAAEAAYLKAIALEPASTDYRYGIVTLYLQQQMPAKARPHIEALVAAQPQNPRFRALLRQVGG
ncbi:MAG: tetratricopeptide repeat protein [Pseudomonadota bacterium]